VEGYFVQFEHMYVCMYVCIYVCTYVHIITERTKIEGRMEVGQIVAVLVFTTRAILSSPQFTIGGEKTPQKFSSSTTLITKPLKTAT
jgi:hypothetical protein